MNIEDLQHMLSKTSSMKLESRGDVREKVLELEYVIKREINKIRYKEGKPPIF
jgi:hypothetical protein